MGAVKARYGTNGTSHCCNCLQLLTGTNATRLKVHVLSRNACKNNNGVEFLQSAAVAMLSKPDVIAARKKFLAGLPGNSSSCSSASVGSKAFQVESIRASDKADPDQLFI